MDEAKQIEAFRTMAVVVMGAGGNARKLQRIVKKIARRISSQGMSLGDIVEQAGGSRDKLRAFQNTPEGAEALDNFNKALRNVCGPEAGD